MCVRICYMDCNPDTANPSDWTVELTEFWFTGEGCRAKDGLRRLGLAAARREEKRAFRCQWNHRNAIYLN